MNWVGGARSRVTKIQGDKRRQKEFFERKKLNLKCERALFAGNGKQMLNKSQDLVAVESFGSTSRRQLFRGVPGNSNVRRVDLDKPCRSRALSSRLPDSAARKVEKVELPFSPDHLPSRLHLLESQTEIETRKNIQQANPSHTSNALREDIQVLDPSAILHRPSDSSLSHETPSVRSVHPWSPTATQAVHSAHAATENSQNPQSASLNVSVSRKRHLLRPSRQQLVCPATKESEDFLSPAAFYSPAALALKVKARSVENTDQEERHDQNPGGNAILLPPQKQIDAAVARFPRLGMPGLTNFWIREEEEEERLRQAEGKTLKRKLSPWMNSGSQATHSFSQATHSDIQTIRSGSQAIRSGSQAIRSGSQATHPDIQAIRSGSQGVNWGSQSVHSGSQASCAIQSFPYPLAESQCCRGSAVFQKLGVCHSPMSDIARKTTRMMAEHSPSSWGQKSEPSRAGAASCGRRQDTSLLALQRPTARGASVETDRAPLQELLLLLPENLQPSPLLWQRAHLEDPAVRAHSRRDLSPYNSPVRDRRTASFSRKGGEDSLRHVLQPSPTPSWHSAELTRVCTPLLDWGCRSQSDSETFGGPRAKCQPEAHTCSGPRVGSQEQRVLLKQRAAQYCPAELQLRSTPLSSCWKPSRPSTGPGLATPHDARQPLRGQLDLLETSLGHDCAVQGCAKQRLSGGEDHIVPECGYISPSSARGGKSRPIAKTPSIQQRSVSYQSHAKDPLKELLELDTLSSPETSVEVQEPARTSAITISGSSYISTTKVPTPKSDLNGEPPLAHSNRLKHSATPARTQNKRVERKLESNLVTEESERRDSKPSTTKPGDKTPGPVSASEQLPEGDGECKRDLPALDCPSLAVAGTDARQTAEVSLPTEPDGEESGKEKFGEEPPSLLQSPEPESDPDGSQRRLEVDIVMQDLAHRAVMLCSASSSSSSCRSPPTLSLLLTPGPTAAEAAATVSVTSLADGGLEDLAASRNPAQNQVSPSPPAQPLAGDASQCGLQNPDLTFPEIKEALDRAKLRSGSAGLTVDKESAPVQKAWSSVHVQTDWSLTEQWLEELGRSSKSSKVDVGIQWQNPS